MSAGQASLTARVEEKIKVVLSTRASASASAVQLSADKLASLIDHTALKPDTTAERIVALCQEAKAYRFAAVCVNPMHVALCRQLLDGTSVEVATVAGFPLGATLPEVKAYEAQRSIAAGATEIDMVLNVGALKDRQYERVLQDIAGVVQVCHVRDVILKVIIEAALLTDEEKVAACVLAQESGADFCKTSTGFGPGGATPEDVALMRRTVGPGMGVKAAGGIRSYQDALRMVGAGATRIGASSGVAIIQEARAKESQ